jgi:voltage-gated potassium channel
MLRALSAALTSLPNHLLGAASLLAILPIVGTLGYVTIEGWNFLDAFYMSIITITTIGFSEVRPLSDGGRVFTIFLAIGGVGAIFYGLIAVFQFLLEGELATLLGVHRMKEDIQSLRDHYILCGFGRVGEEVAREFLARNVPFVIVESNPEAVSRARQRDYLLLEGDATGDPMLLEAGIDRARCVLAASDSDSGNTFIVITAKALNPDVFVVARAGQKESEPRLLRAGADRVFSPYLAAGRHMALSALQPLLIGLVDSADEQDEAGILAEIEISKDGGLVGRSISEVLGASPTTVVLGVQKATGEISVGPRPDSILSTGDRLILMGREEDLASIHPARGHGSAIGG